MNEISNDKSYIRKQNLEFRNRQSENDLLSWSLKIFEKVNRLKQVINARNIMCYVSFGSEVQTHMAIKEWISQGKNISVPCIENVSKQDRYMHAVKISDFSELSKCGSYGILEPPLVKSNIAEPESLEAIIVPGSAFDICRNRMGFGGGFYDRYLPKASEKCVKIGVCFDFQVMEHIPVESYDIPLDLLVTEKRII